MDREMNASEARRSGSFSLTNSADSSLRRRSINLSRLVAPQDDDIESESVSQAGDIGDRALQSYRYSESGSQRIGNCAFQSSRCSESGSVRFSTENVVEVPVDVPILEASLLKSYSVRSTDPSLPNETSPISLLPLEIISSVPPDVGGQSVHETLSTKKELPVWLEYTSSLLHLAVFGILGVLTRYYLRKLFGPGLADITSDKSLLYADLPSNMVGSFLMGWFGVEFKGDISSVSDLLAIGLTTGYLGSLTTFSGWNQEMLDLSVKGHWVSTVLGFVLGLFLAAYSLIFGVETARGFRWLLQRKSSSSGSVSKWRVDSRERHLAVMLVMVLFLGLLWGLSGALLGEKFDSDSTEAELWLGCLVGPTGVWIRWLLARLNGRGLGTKGLFKWIPFGTLIANVSAACIMAGLETLMKAVNTRRCDTVVTGIQLGFLGCLSTVSTFIAEFGAMRQSTHPWRAYLYALITIATAFSMGTLIYSIPVWVKGYN